MIDLDPTKAFIFRIAHVECVPWILQHGIHCRTSSQQDPHYINIGSKDLIEKRSRKTVPILPGGTLSDYVPFYFTPLSIMLYNIHTGHSVPQRSNEQIVIFVSSLHDIQAHGLPFVFTNQHAYAADTDYFNELAQLDRIDCPLLRAHNFKTDDADPGKQLRYQAEALVHRHVPLQALRGIACYDDVVKAKLESLIAAHGSTLKVVSKPGWYFR